MTDRLLYLGTSQSLERFAERIGAEPLVYAHDVAEAATWGRKLHCDLCQLSQADGMEFHKRLAALGLDSREMTPAQRVEAVKTGVLNR